MPDEIINKVASSGLLTIDLEQYYPKQEVRLLDLKPFLFHEQIIKEKEFRASLAEVQWNEFSGKIVAIICTADAIIPAWAYMLVASYLQPVAHNVFIGDAREAVKDILISQIQQIDETQYEGKRLIIKGCGQLSVDMAAYLEITKKLLPVAKSIMYGEACSNVPVFKKK